MNNFGQQLIIIVDYYFIQEFVTQFLLHLSVYIFYDSMHLRNDLIL